ncbi:hypothetical protein AAG906_000829 [Vitis piasezkii]
MNQMAPLLKSNQMAPLREGATSTLKQPLRVTCDLHHKFEMEIPHEDQSSHYDHEKDKFAYLSMRDRIEGSKYALNEDISMKAKLASMARRIEEFELRNVHTEVQPQAMPTSFEYNNHPNLTTQPQPQPSMSTSSLEQAILKISKVMEDFVGKQQNINSHFNEKIDNMESSINVRMERQGEKKLPPQPHHNLQGTNAKRSRKVLKIDTLVGDCYENSMDQPSIENHKVQDDKGLLEPFKASTSPGKRRETNSLGPNGKDANFGEKPKQSNSHHPISATVGNILITSRSSFHAYYISFQSLGSQKSIGSNGARFGVETKKLWPFEDDCAKLNGNVAAAPHFATVGHVLEHFLELKLCIPYLF